jgi:NTP pyrophosphatase (non-canonical NTP hydrolase)
MEEEQVVGRIAEELLDVAQVAISMMYVLEETYSIDIQEKVDSHIEKLIGKGYIKG